MSEWNASGELRTIPQLLRGAADAVPDKVALYLGDESLTYRELLDRALRAAAGLHELGIRPGDAAGTLAVNSIDQVAVMLGCNLLGAVCVPVNVEYKGDFLRHQSSVAEVKVVLADEDLAIDVVKVAPELPHLQHLVVRGDPAAAGGQEGPLVHSARDALLAPDARLPAGITDPRGDTIGAVIFTAGTTGLSKGVAMSQNYLCSSAEQVFDLRGGTPDSVVYAALPLFHLAALSTVVLGPLTRHATAALDNRFSPNAFWDRVRKFNADQTVLLGAMITMLWNRPERDDDADNPVSVALVAPMPPAIHRPFEKRFGLTALQMYSQSEAYPLIVSAASAPAPPGYSGRPNPLFTVKLFDDDDVEVPVGEVGEVVVRPNAPHVMFEGYWKDPVGTLAKWRNGWMHTGDLGRFDEDGYFAFVDRKKDYLRRRGENISSFEVERVAMQYPDVAEVAVVAAPSELTEDEVAACVVLRGETADFDHRAFLDHCAANMPYFAVPRYVWVMPELPRNPVGRVQKFRLREALSGLPGSMDGVWDAQAHGYAPPRRGKVP